MNFNDRQKSIDKQTKEIAQQIIKKIDDFLDTNKSKVEYLKCGKIFFHFRKHADKSLSEYCQRYAIREALREIYSEKGWYLNYEYRWYFGLPLKDKIIGITLRSA